MMVFNNWLTKFLKKITFCSHMLAPADFNIPVHV